MSALNWLFKLPTAVTFGDGCVQQLPQIAAAHGARPLLVADCDLVRLPVFARVQEVLPGIPVFSDVTPDPTVASVDALAARLPCMLRDAGIPREDIPLLARESFHPLMRNNPRTMTEADLVAMYERLA